jgi:hypothetical protein
LSALLAAGLVADAGALAAKAPPSTDPELARLVADSILLSGDAKDACGPQTGMRLSSSDTFWVELRAWCYASEGDSDMLELTRAVMKTDKIDASGFDALLDAAASHQAPDVAPVTEPTSLDVFLYRSLGVPIDPAWSQSLGLPAGMIVLNDTGDSPQQRLAAAEAIAPTGLAPPDALAGIADAQSFTPDELAGAEVAAGKMGFVAGQALLRQAARQAPDARVRKWLVYLAFSLADARGLLPVAATIQGSAASSIIPDKDDRPHMPLMTAALLLAGRAEAAARWYNTLDPKADADQPVVHLLQAELDLVEPTPARDFEAQGAYSWFTAQASEKSPIGGDATTAHALLVLGTADALGRTLPKGAAQALTVLQAHTWPGRRPGAEVFVRLASARKDGWRKGDALLSILDFLGSRGPADIAPDVTVAFVKALARMGYADAAQALASDALLLYRPTASSAIPS